MLIYKPDLAGVISYYEAAERYYQRNRELIEKCAFVHAFFSKENGYKEGTKLRWNMLLSLESLSGFILKAR